jgi:prepilin-type N-terminal cleavage/methylation domain-containing protein
MRSRKSQSGLTLMELLIAMGIMSVLSVMILVSWFALSSSYSYSVTSSKAREHARDGIARLEREVRAVQDNAATSDVGLVRARTRTIIIESSFNVMGNEDPTAAPRLVVFRLYPNGELWRFYDTDGNGAIDLNGGAATLDPNLDGWPANPYDSNEPAAVTDGKMLLARNVVNDVVPSAGAPTPLFRYSYYAADGSLTQATSVLGMDNRAKVVAAQINLLVDLNPAHSPVYTELQTTAHVRNQQ